MKHLLWMSAILTFALPLAGCSGPEAEADNDPSVSSESALEAKSAFPLNHCVVRLEPVSSDGNEQVARDSPPTCFRAFSEAIAFATDGRARISPDETPETVTESALNGPSAQSSIVLGIDYEKDNGQGASLTSSAASKCVKGSLYQSGSLPKGWNDKISSARTFADCRSTHYEHINFGGASLPIPRNGYVPKFGALNDETSSIKWYF